MNEARKNVMDKLGMSDIAKKSISQAKKGEREAEFEMIGDSYKVCVKEQKKDDKGNFNYDYYKAEYTCDNIDDALNYIKEMFKKDNKGNFIYKFN